MQAYDMDSGLNGDVEYSLDVHPEDSPMYRDDDDDLNGIGSPNISPFSLLRINPKSGGLMVLRTLKNGERIHAQVCFKSCRITTIFADCGLIRLTHYSLFQLRNVV